MLEETAEISSLKSHLNEKRINLYIYISKILALNELLHLNLIRDQLKMCT